MTNINYNKSLKILNLDGIPSTFSGEKYIELYPKTKDYFNNTGFDLDISCKMYHHYLQYGKIAGYAVDHTSVPVFYHIPRCGGTTLHYSMILPNLYNQYSIHKTNKLYNINFIDESTRYNLFSLICYSKPNCSIEKLLYDITKYNNDMNIDLANIIYSDNNILTIKNNMNILSIIINSKGFSQSDYILNQMLDSTNKDLYIILRDPLEWHLSLFYYLRDMGTWEEDSAMYTKDMKFSDYIYSDIFKQNNNWLIKTLLNMSDDSTVNHKEVDLCIQKLSQFTCVGFLNKFNNFTTTLFAKYNWLHLDDSDHIKYNANNISHHEKLISQDLYYIIEKLNYENVLYRYFYNN